MTIAQFVEWDDGTDTRYELVRGRPVAMAPPMARHGELTTNIFGILIGQLKRPCRPLFGAGIARSDDDDDYRIPDIFVTREPTPRHYFMQARLVVEVLSRSTERVDRSEKLDFYQSVPSVEAILFVWQDRRRVQLQLRGAEGWLVLDRIAAGHVAVPGLGLSLGVEEIYAGVELEEAPSEAEPEA